VARLAAPSLEFDFYLWLSTFIEFLRFGWLSLLAVILWVCGDGLSAMDGVDEFTITWKRFKGLLIAS
jgi:hypothetical protein